MMLVMMMMMMVVATRKFMSTKRNCQGSGSAHEHVPVSSPGTTTLCLVGRFYRSLSHSFPFISLFHQTVSLSFHFLSLILHSFIVQDDRIHRVQPLVVTTRSIRSCVSSPETHRRRHRRRRRRPLCQRSKAFLVAS